MVARDLCSRRRAKYLYLVDTYLLTMFRTPSLNTYLIIINLPPLFLTGHIVTNSVFMMAFEL